MKYKKGDEVWIRAIIKHGDIDNDGEILVETNNGGLFYCYPPDQLHKAPEPFKVGEELEYSDDGENWTRGPFEGYACANTSGLEMFFRYARRPEKKEIKEETPFKNDEHDELTDKIHNLNKRIGDLENKVGKNFENKESFVDTLDHHFHLDKKSSWPLEKDEWEQIKKELSS